MRYKKRYMNIVESSGVKEAYHVAFRENAAKKAKRKTARAARKRNRG